jgi:hypothetical protein
VGGSRVLYNLYYETVGSGTCKVSIGTSTGISWEYDTEYRGMMK